MRRQPLAVVALACAGLCACYSWHPEPLAPEVTRALPAHTRIVQSTGQRVEVASGRVTQDSIIGVRSGGERVALPRDSVAFVEERQFSWGRTLGLAGGIYLIGASVLVAALGGV